MISRSKQTGLIQYESSIVALSRETLVFNITYKQLGNSNFTNDFSLSPVPGSR